MQPAQYQHPESFVPLYHNYNRLVASIAANFPLSPQQQEEICQDVFLIVWQRKQQLQHEKALTSWLSTITRHRCLSELRRSRTTLTLEEVGEEQLQAEQEPLQALHLEISLRLLERLINEHRSPVRRRVAQLFYSNGQSVQSISTALGICPNTVLSHLRRFRLVVEKSLLSLLEERGIEMVPA